jgi:hypothetical protein
MSGPRPAAAYQEAELCTIGGLAMQRKEKRGKQLTVATVHECMCTIRLARVDGFCQANGWFVLIFYLFISLFANSMMDAKICLVTGANAGIGLETAKSFCARGATTVLVCHSVEKAQLAIAEIEGEVSAAIVTTPCAFFPRVTYSGQEEVLCACLPATTLLFGSEPIARAFYLYRVSRNSGSL